MGGLRRSAPVRARRAAYDVRPSSAVLAPPAGEAFSPVFAALRRGAVLVMLLVA